MFWIKLPSGDCYINLEKVRTVFVTRKSDLSRTVDLYYGDSIAHYHQEDAETILRHMESIHSDALVEHVKRVTQKGD